MHPTLTFLEETIQLKNSLEESFIHLGERMLRIRDERLYEGKYENFEEFLGELKISPATASKMINIYQTFVLKFEFSRQELIEAGGWTGLYKISSLCKTKDEAKEWVKKAKELSSEDLDIVVREEKSGVAQYECPHNEETYTIMVCKKCGDKIKTA